MSYENKILMHWNYFYWTAMKMYFDKTIIEDVVQDLYVKFFSKSIRQRYGDKSSKELRNIMQKSLQRMFIDYLRTRGRNKRENHTNILPVDEVLDIRSGDKTDAFLLLEEIKVIINNIENDNNRKALQLHIDGYRYKEISEQMNTPINSVKSYIRRARIELKQKI